LEDISKVYIGCEGTIFMSKEGDVEIKFSFSGLKKRGNLTLLVLILLLGLYFRVYHLDYPVVGYHNWKEAHYLTEARNFAREGFFEHGFFIPAVDFPHISGEYSDPSGAHTDPFPIESILLSILFMVFGFSLAIARLFNVLLGLAGIVFIYLIVKKLFKREDLALLTALLMAISPLFIFFSRQVQEVNPALFFALFSIYMYLKWRDDFKTKYLVLTALFMAISFVNKYSFALFAVPIFFTFPFSKLKEKKYLIQSITSFAVFALPVLFWYFYSKVKGAELNTLVAATQFKPSVLFTPEFWKILNSYIADNYTILGIIFALIGMVAFIYFFKKKFEYKFILWYLIGSVPWIFVMSDKLSGHAYHQYPIAPLIIFFMAYSFLIISTNISRVVKIKWTKFFVLAILIIILLIPSLQSRDRVFDVQFVGLDVAGEYIQENSEVNERILFPGHQSYGVLWHADRKGFAEIPNESQIIYAENELNVTWIFLYQWGLDTINTPQWNYISNNYHLEQLGFQIQSNGQTSIVYILLKKGGNFDPNSLNNLTISPDTVMSKNYEFSFGEVPFYYYSP